MFRSLLSALAAIAIAAGTVGLIVLQEAPAGVPMPDLRIIDWFVVPDAAPAVMGNQVKVAKRYTLCYRVLNAGTAVSDSFVVGGGALGIPFNPTSGHSALLPGATTTGCLRYPTTPAPGAYALGVKADYFNTVAESDEANNELVEPIEVLP
jgi:subtilase family serine protease